MPIDFVCDLSVWLVPTACAHGRTTVAPAARPSASTSSDPCLLKRCRHRRSACTRARSALCTAVSNIPRYYLAILTTAPKHAGTEFVDLDASDDIFMPTLGRVGQRWEECLQCPPLCRCDSFEMFVEIERRRKRKGGRHIQQCKRPRLVTDKHVETCRGCRDRRSVDDVIRFPLARLPC